MDIDELQRVLPEFKNVDETIDWIRDYFGQEVRKGGDFLSVGNDRDNPDVTIIQMFSLTGIVLMELMLRRREGVWVIGGMKG